MANAAAAPARRSATRSIRRCWACARWSARMRCGGVIRPRQRSFMGRRVVGERQRFRILHRSDAVMLQWVDGNNTTNSKRASLTIALRRHSRRADGETAQKERCKKSLPSSPRPPHNKPVLHRGNIVHFDSQFRNSSVERGTVSDGLIGLLNLAEPTGMPNYCSHGDKSYKKEDDAYLHAKRVVVVHGAPQLPRDRLDR
jgi:hypothetical protein